MVILGYCHVGWVVLKLWSTAREFGPVSLSRLESLARRAQVAADLEAISSVGLKGPTFFSFFSFILNGGNELTPSSPWTLQGSFSPFSGSARSIESNCRAPCKGSLASGGCFFTYLLSSKLVFGSGGLEATGCLPIQRER